MASFRSLPAELVLEVGGWLIKFKDRCGLAALARTNRFCHSVLTTALFTEFGPDAVHWAAENGRLDILKAALLYAKDRDGGGRDRLLNTIYILDLGNGPCDWEPQNPPLYETKVENKYGTPLHAACAKGYLDIVAYLLDNGADYTVPSNHICDCHYMDDCLGEYFGDDEFIDQPKWLPLHHAICNGHTDIALLLLDRGAPLYVSSSSASRGRYSVTALQSAAANGLVTVVRYLKDRFQQRRGPGLPGADPADSHVFGNEMDTILTDADEAMDTLSDLEDGEPFDSDMSDTGGLAEDDGGDDFDETDESGSMDISESDSEFSGSDDDAGTDDGSGLDFWGQMADPRDPRSIDQYGNTAMHYLTLCSDFDAACVIVKDLQELGLNIDERGGRRDGTPLLTACCMGSFSAARALLQAGAFPEAVLEEDFMTYDELEGDTSCLDNALCAHYSPQVVKGQSVTEWKKQRYEFVKELIKAGVELEELPGENNTTALSIAAKHGLEDEVRLLLELGNAYVNATSDNGETALMAAAEKHHVGAVRVLLEAGADVNVTNRLGLSAVDYACPPLHPERYVIPTTRDRYCSQNSKEVLKLLLENGARVGIPVDAHDPICRTPCVHDSFFLRTIRKASLVREDCTDQANELNTKFGQVPLDIMLEHSTQANITRECWQTAVMEAFTMTKSGAAHPAVCQKLGAFGRKLGYVLDDSILGNLIIRLFLDDNPRDIEPLFLLGDGETVQSATGVLTRMALLALALVRQVSEDDDGVKLVGPLIESVKDVKGVIRQVKNKSTLLHLAAAGDNVDNVKMLLDKGCELNAVNLHSLTPLAEAVRGGDIEIVKLLLDRGADPYFAHKQSSPGKPSLPGPADDVLGLPPGQTLARAAVEMLARVDCIPCLYLDEPSAFEIAVRKGRNIILEEFIKRKKYLPPVAPDATSSYMRLACNHQHYQTVHLLLRHGADPNGGGDQTCPPIVSLMIVLQYVGTFFHRDVEKKREEALKMLGVIAHLIRAGADVNAKSKTNKQSAVTILERILEGNGPETRMVQTHLPGGAINGPQQDHFPLKELVEEFFVIKEDANGKKSIKCLNGGMDSFVR